jgi:hypothetical protein
MIAAARNEDGLCNVPRDVFCAPFRIHPMMDLAAEQQDLQEEDS